MNQPWPDDTALSPSCGTHLVARTQLSDPTTIVFLRAPNHPTETPTWTASRNEAGRWFLYEAAKLAGIHSGIGDRGQQYEALTEPVEDGVS